MLYKNYHEALSDEYLYTEDHSSYHEALSDGYLHIEDHDSRLDLARHFDGYLHIAKNTADTKWYVHLLGMYCSLFDLTTRNEEGIWAATLNKREGGTTSRIFKFSGKCDTIDGISED